MRAASFISLLFFAIAFFYPTIHWAQDADLDIITEPTELLKEDNFDPNFKDRYQGEKYNYEGKEIVGTTRGGSGEYEDFEEGKKPSNKEENNTSEIINNSSFALLDWLFILALVLAVVYLAYILLNDGSQGLFTGNRKKRVTIPEEISVENIEQTNVNSLIDLAENEGNYRLAIRYYYLLVLKNLSLKNYIKLEDDKTNQEYYNEIADRGFSDSFSYTSYLYNYIWYGEFEIDKEQYGKAKESFEQLINVIR